MSAAQKLRFYHRLQLAAHRAQKAADRAVMDAAGVTTAQAAVLAVIRQGGGAVSQRDVSRQLGLNESAVTQMAGRLLKLGLIKRDRDPFDARAWRLSLSNDGLAALKRLEQPFAGINAVFDAVSDEEALTAFARALTRIADSFDEAP